VLNLAPLSQPEGNAGNSPMSFTATLSRPVEGVVTANFATTDATAQVADNDYLAANGTLSFASGVTSQSITVQVVGDGTVESDERYGLALSNLTRPPGITAIALGASTAVEGTIGNDDTATLTLTNATVTEGNTGTTALNFTVTASSASAIPLGATVTTSNGSAVAPADYAALAGVAVSVPPGAAGRTVTIPVNINGDVILEADETLTATLSAPSTGATIGGGPATGTIANDDATAISIGDVRQFEGTADGAAAGTTTFRFPVTLSNPSELPVSVQFATADQTATAPADYVATSGSATFAPGSQTTEVVVQVVPDGLIEIDETFSVQLTNPAPAQATLARASATGTIRSDDIPAVPVDDFRALLLLALLALSSGIFVLRRSH
jgi:chitinase